MEAVANKELVDFDITLLCKVLGSNLGAEVVEDPYAKTFSTNGRRVTIPANIAGGEMTAKIMRYGLAHEAAGHMAHTDFDALNAWPAGANPITFGFFNIIEDPRIEKCAQNDYPGVRKINHEGIEELERRGFFVLPDEEAHPASIISSWLIRRLRVDLLKQPLAIDRVESLAKSVFDQATLDQILSVAKKGATGKATQDATAAAEGIMKILKDAAEPPKDDPEQQGNEGDPSENEEGNGAGQGGQQGAGDQTGGQGAGSAPGGEQDGDDDDGAGQAAAGPTQAQSDAARKVLEASKDDMGATDMSEVIGKAVEHAQNESKGSGRGRYAGVVRRNDRRSNAHYNASALASNLSSKLRSRMQELLRARVEDEDDELDDRGRLDMRRLPRGIMGDRNIFTVDGSEGEGVSTAVHLLVDASGSMSDYGKANAASAIIYALSTAIAPYETQGAKFAISAFDHMVHDLKRFEDRWIKAKNWIGHYRPMGSTMMSDAMRTVLTDVACQREKRKILLVITDGDVGDTDVNARINSTAKAAGVEVHLLVIGGSKPSQQHGFKSSEAVPANDQAQIQKAIFGLLTRFIR